MVWEKTKLDLAFMSENIPFLISGYNQGEKGEDPGGPRDGG